jgi:hypothetical protein
MAHGNNVLAQTFSLLNILLPCLSVGYVAPPIKAARSPLVSFVLDHLGRISGLKALLGAATRAIVDARSSGQRRVIIATASTKKCEASGFCARE